MKESWALPFWDYDRGGDTASLPTAFREPTLADGTTPNPLFTELRNGNLMLGGPLDPRLTSAARALAEGFFSNDPVPGVTVGFGGAITGWNHFDENAEAAPGELEGTPHNVIHGAVGATPGGLMRRVDTAALDPIFWLHHANVDRLWGEWLELDGRANPQEADWLEEPFRFRDENGGSVRITSAEVVSTEELGYEYEEVERPGLLADEGRPAMPTEPPPDRPPELVGATDAPLTLTGGEEHVAIHVSESARPALLAGEGEEPQRVYVNVEGIQGEENPGVSYAVYVNLPDDADPGTADRHHVGNVSFFGIELARDVGGDPRGGHGLRYAFDITDLVRDAPGAGPLGSERGEDHVRAAAPAPAAGRGGGPRGRGGAARREHRPRWDLLPVTALALRRSTWIHPELTAAAAAAAAWALLGGHALVPHSGTEPFLAGLSGWIVMAAAMMLPGTLADMRRLALSSMWSRRQRTIAVFLGSYLAVWTCFGALALAGLPLLGAGTGILLASAAAWELSPWKWRALRRCHLVEPLPPRGARADAACVRAGLRYGGRCVVSCWPLMLAMAAAGHLALALMALVTIVATAEKLVVRSARLRAPAAALLAGAAVVTLV